MSYKKTQKNNSLKSENNTQAQWKAIKIKLIKKNQLEILEQENIMSEMKKAIESMNSRMDKVEERR